MNSRLFDDRRRVPVLRGMLCLAFVLGCGHERPHKTETSDEGSVTQVTTVRPARKTLVRTIELPGRTEAFEFAPLCAKVTGYVQNVPVDIGDLIQGPKGDHPGTVLCELLVPELVDELAQKVATIAQTNAEVVQADAQVKVVEAAVASAEAAIREIQASATKAEAWYVRRLSEHERVVELAKSGSVTKKLADETKAELEAADAGRKEISAKISSVTAAHQEAVARLDKAKADALAVRARLKVVEAEKRRMESMVDYSTLRAPFDGIVVERNVHTGHLVQAGNPKPLLSVMRLDPIRVFVDVPEDDAVRVTKESKVELRVPSSPAEPFVGTITRTGWSLSTTSRTMLTEIDVPNPKGEWRPGLYVHAKITVAELPNAISLPRNAILTHEKQTFCYTVEADGKVSRRDIAVGLQAGPDVEIRSGLTGDETVISLNPNAFREGQIVRVSEPLK